ncbi:MAG: Membrane protein involved in the export of O-antigen, teichoic acid lipoteichoic acids [uncultured Sulfurovum sp.]|uniref:Membrane protein involved in the export of O-antigen, teichoic acid lipoteichoic acids n=1 Tax=uncultured Sulfurovum sp. TaxID=269237 RepID=A0A6S6TDM4_9BACT|nr:MAG: Membrane protein involved in the export of O-antigen, teichoic acid lipoteichoic acids [uncultured Sulfurovum sp.]
MKILANDLKRLKSNFLALSFLQATNYILPLITLPYLIQVLGVEYFGLLAFATAIITYFSILTDYGFNLTATKEISLHRHNKNKIIEIYSAVMSIKFILLIISFLLLCTLIFSFERFEQHWQIYLLSFGSVLGQFLFPIWIFQGMEKMKYISYLNIISKLIFTIAIFIFIKTKNDIYLVPLFFSLGSIVAGLLSLYYIKKEFNISFKFQNKNILKYYLIDGWHVFLSRFYVSLYTTTNILLLGLLSNNLAVGYYAIVEKIVLAIGGIFQPLNQTIYPYLVKKQKECFNTFVQFLKKISAIFLLASLVFILLAEYFVEELVFLIHGEDNLQVSFLLSIFLLRIFVLPFGSLLSNTLIIMEQKKSFIKVMNYTVVSDLMIVPVAIYYFQETGLVISFLIIIVIHTLFLWYYVNHSIQKFRIKNDS